VSFAQERLWFLDKMRPGNPAYNVPSLILWPGKIDTAALNKAVNTIIDRHEILRTNFRFMDNQPVQIIHPRLHIDIPVVHLKETVPYKRDEELESITTSEARYMFDLSNDSLMRIRLIRIDDTMHLLMLTMHHIICDGWSMGLLFDELAVLYKAFSEGTASPLKDLEIQYADFAYWQRKHMNAQHIERQLSYWKSHLKDIPPLIALPYDSKRPVIQSFEGAEEEFTIATNIRNKLIAIAQKNGATLFMILLAAFKVMLYKYTGQKDIVVGSPIANRNRRELENLIGFFVNTLLFRTKVDSEETFIDFLRQVSEVNLKAYSHQDLPYEKLVEELKPPRSLSYNPLFQVMFVLQNFPTSARADDSGKNTMVRPSFTMPKAVTGKAKFDLTLFLMETADELVGRYEYSCDLFTKQSIQRMVGHYRTILETVTQQPEIKVADISLISLEERDTIINTWNATAVPLGNNETIKCMFERQAETSPDAIAVRWNNEAVSYAQLNRDANKVARYLRNKGVGPNVKVGLSIQRSITMVIGLLGICKSGGVFVPIDPNLPSKRREYMIQTSGMSLLLTESRHMPTGYDLETVTWIGLDTEWEAIMKEEDTNPEFTLGDDDLAYIIFTSGSTGNPKGVMISQLSIYNQIRWVTRTLGINEKDRILQKTTLSFDASLWELFAPLLSGGQLILADAAGERDCDYLIRTIIDSGVTIVQVVPSMLNVLLENSNFGRCRSLRWVCSGGESLLYETKKKFNSVMEARLCNLYGPSEVTINATYHIVDREIDESRDIIGKATDNIKALIVNNDGNLMPINVIGELYFTGIGVAKGYVNGKELTQKSFYTMSIAGERYDVYRTGDLARYLPDGTIEFFGRSDRQVKVRGMRIELEEITTILERHPQVMGSVVTLHEEGIGDTRIVAYIVPKKGAVVSRRELRDHLRNELPDYMIPSHFIDIESIPYLPNGKIAYDQLSIPDVIRPELESPYHAPRNEIESQVIEIWKSVLHVAKVGIHDDFFELGGHSLLAIQIISRIRELFETEINVERFFEMPVVSKQAEYIEAILSTTRASALSLVGSENELEEGVL